MTALNMLIGIDGNEANQIKRVGVGEYGFQLLMQLKVQGSTLNQSKLDSGQGLEVQGQNLKFQIYLKEKPLSDLPQETEWWRYKVVGPKFLWTQIGLPIALSQVKPVLDVFFTPTHYAPRFSPCPRVISIMDLSYIYFPEMFRKRDLWKLKKWTNYSVKKAKKILTISESTKSDIIKYYKVEPGKVAVTYPGIDKKFAALKTLKNMESTEKIKKKYGIKGDYILYVGTLQPRKNLVRLIEAFGKIKRQRTDNKEQKRESRNGKREMRNTEEIDGNTIEISGNKEEERGNLKLVIAGKRGWMYEEIFEKVKDLGLEKEVVFTGYVSDKDLPSLYKGAECFVLVSLYEGFGLPVLEALSYGVPVVVSNISSLPEVAGDAGVLVNPHNVKDIVRGINKALNYDKTKRQEMIKKGLEQVKKFSWEKCARETLEVLMEAGKGNKLT